MSRNFFSSGLSGKNATDLPELLDLNGGVFGISEDMAVQPLIVQVLGWEGVVGSGQE